MNIVVMGPQGSGKTTQAELLAKKLSSPHIEMGATLRIVAQEKSGRGKRMRGLLATGVLIPDAEVLGIIKERLQSKDCDSGFVLDGIPRTLNQAQKLDEILGSIGQQIDRVFYIKVSDETGVKRLVKRGRADDTPAAIKKRLALYHYETEPVLQFYREKGILVELDGEESIEEIRQEIAEKL
ncbi:MAG: nucleoside monophosphate kinase [Candidatus Cloacimonetes bacterium]|nr:nucleoside monophosphate kinase [Candidatus Cloacimonadota bacterium]